MSMLKVGYSCGQALAQLPCIIDNNIHDSNNRFSVVVLFKASR